MREPLTLYTPSNIFWINIWKKIRPKCDNHYTTRTTTLATQQSKVWLTWFRDVGLPGNFSLEGDRVVEAFNSICNPSKDQFNDAQHQANLVGYKGGSIHH